MLDDVVRSCVKFDFSRNICHNKDATFRHDFLCCDHLTTWKQHCCCKACTYQTLYSQLRILLITHVVSGITCRVQLLRPFDRIEEQRDKSQQMPTMLDYVATECCVRLNIQTNCISKVNYQQIPNKSQKVRLCFSSRENIQSMWTLDMKAWNVVYYLLVVNVTVLQLMVWSGILVSTF